MGRSISRKAVIIIIGLFLSFFAISCSNGQENQGVASLGPPETELAYPHPAKIVTALELGWGDGDYEVGYINDEFEDLARRGEEGIGAGPYQFCVDGEGSIYIDDTMNFRILKYSPEGEYLGQFEKNRITDRIAVLAVGVAAGLDCIYLYEPGEDVLYRYRFQNDELKTIDFSKSGYSHRIKNLHVIYDGEGRTYIKGEGSPEAKRWTYYIIDSSFSTILETREILFEYGLMDYVDDDGSFYFIPRRKSIDTQYVLYRVDSNNDISAIVQFPENMNDAIVKEVGKPENLAIFLGYYVTEDGRVVQKIETSGIRYYPENFYTTRNLDLFFRQPRPYNPDDKSPFHIYKVEIDWDALVE